MDRHVVALALIAVLAGCVQAPSTFPNDAGGPPDPATDRLGWESGYWYNESLSVTVDDGLTKPELTAVVRRAMARVEHIRRLEFERPVPVDIISRRTYRERDAGAGTTSNATRAFDNVKFEAAFLVGEDGDSIHQQTQNRGSSVLGFYSPNEDRIVIVSETDTPAIRETTLGHELVHALQFRNFEMNYERSTRDEANAISGLIEGDASYVDRVYSENCGQAWRCVAPPAQGGDGGTGGGFHFGIYIMKYFPYADGPGFITHFRRNGGWDRVNRLYENPPNSAEQVAVPSKYLDDPPVNVSLADRSDQAWKRVTATGRAPDGELGVSGLTAMFAWPSYHQESDGDGTNRGVLPPQSFLNVQPDGEVSRADPFDYTSPPVEGWEGDKLSIYEHTDGSNAYVWKFAWESPRDTREFATTYRDLLRYWGGERVATTKNGEVWRIDAGPFADAFSIHVAGDTVVVVNAPALDRLDDVRAGTPTAASRVALPTPTTVGGNP